MFILHLDWCPQSDKPFFVISYFSFVCLIILNYCRGPFNAVHQWCSRKSLSLMYANGKEHTLDNIQFRSYIKMLRVQSTLKMDKPPIFLLA